ncbi:hypothetical protein OWV82_022003 [Melia azedarach]|uniref:Uncharacterized protein n=1 Tax=Melia azedarach TaxID=155640 RepID=A0ACC1X1Z5_MELAZ|nr:hypothetical protein OWV82_022003 [Melia azedarach]
MAKLLRNSEMASILSINGNNQDKKQNSQLSHISSNVSICSSLQQSFHIDQLVWCPNPNEWIWLPGLIRAQKCESVRGHRVP